MATRLDLENALHAIGWFVDEETMEITNDLGYGTKYFVSNDYNTITRREDATILPTIGIAEKFTIEQLVIEANEDQDQVYFKLSNGEGETSFPFLILNKITQE